MYANKNGPADADVITVTIRKISISGALVELPDGTKPGHEMYPDFKLHEDLCELTDLKPGDSLAVVAFDSELGGKRKLVSHVRAALPMTRRHGAQSPRMLFALPLRMDTFPSVDHGKQVSIASRAEDLGRELIGGWELGSLLTDWRRTALRENS